MPSAPALDALLGRFDALLRRLEAEARRDGLYEDGPMTRVLELLQLCMAILCQVTSLNVRTTERHASQVVGAIKGAKDGAEAAVEVARSNLARQMEGEQDRFAERIATSVASRTDQAIGRRAAQFPVKMALWVAMALAGSNAVTGLVVYARTGPAVAAEESRKAAIAGVLATVRATRDGLYDAFQAEGLAGAVQWLKLMQWNHILVSLKECSNQQDLLFRDANGRLVCKVPLWIEPKTTAPPPDPSPDPALHGSMGVEVAPFLPPPPPARQQHGSARQTQPFGSPFGRQ